MGPRGRPRVALHQPYWDFWEASLGVWAASSKLVAEPWPEWQMVQPNFSAECGLLESTNRSRRGWAENWVTWDGDSLTARALRGRSDGRR